MSIVHRAKGVANNMETYHLTIAQDNVTGEYRQVGYMRFDDEASRILQFWFWAFVTAVAAFVFFILARNFGKLPDSFRIGSWEIVVGILAFAATVVIHEWMHGLIMQMYGARPKLGMSRNNLIATLTAPGFGFRRNTVILIALTPLVMLTCIALLGIWLVQGTPWVALFALMAVINAGAAITDLWLVGVLLRYPGNAWTVDDRDGMRILMPLE